MKIISSKANSHIWEKIAEFSGVQTFHSSDAGGPNPSQPQEKG